MVRAVGAGVKVVADIFIGFMGDDCVDDTKQRRGSDSPVSVGLGELKKNFGIVSFSG